VRLRIASAKMAPLMSGPSGKCCDRFVACISVGRVPSIPHGTTLAPALSASSNTWPPICAACCEVLFSNDHGQACCYCVSRLCFWAFAVWCWFFLPEWCPYLRHGPGKIVVRSPHAFLSSAPCQMPVVRYWHHPNLFGDLGRLV
jgi:hypothetical protein